MFMPYSQYIGEMTEKLFPREDGTRRSSARCFARARRGDILLNLAHRAMPSVCCFAISGLVPLYSLPEVIRSHSVIVLLCLLSMCSPYFLCRFLPRHQPMPMFFGYYSIVGGTFQYSLKIIIGKYFLKSASFYPGPICAAERSNSFLI